MRHIFQPFISIAQSFSKNECQTWYMKMIESYLDDIKHGGELAE